VVGRDDGDLLKEKKPGSLTKDTNMKPCGSYFHTLYQLESAA